jgi:hypothetical protein
MLTFKDEGSMLPRYVGMQLFRGATLYPGRKESSKNIPSQKSSKKECGKKLN